MTAAPLTWPRRNPFDKRWFQIAVASQRTKQRNERLQAIILRWEPRLWERGLNLPDRLLAEARRVALLVHEGACDWTRFPEWVDKVAWRERIGA